MVPVLAIAGTNLDVGEAEDKGLIDHHFPSQVQEPASRIDQPRVETDQEDFKTI